MANLKVQWVLPTTRQSGKPLAVSDIANVKIELSADGANFADFGVFTPDVLETVVTELEVGEWFVRGTVVDTAGRSSPAKAASYVIEDTTAPSELVSLTLSL
jgi:hypothetical protein